MTSKNDLNCPKSKEKSFRCHFLKFGDVFIWSFLVSTIYLWDDLQKSIRFPFIKCQHVVIPTCKPYSGLGVFTCAHHSIQGYNKGHFFWLTYLSGACYCFPNSQKYLNNHEWSWMNRMTLWHWSIVSYVNAGMSGWQSVHFKSDKTPFSPILANPLCHRY